MNRTTLGTRPGARARHSLRASLLSSAVAAAAALTSAGAHAQSAPPAAAVTPVPVQANLSVEITKAPGPRMISDWDQDQPIPAGYHPATRARTGAIVGGIVPFAILYFISALTAAVVHDASHGSDTSDDGLYLPVIGPFVTMTHSSTATGTFFLVLDGLGQSAGAALFIWGITSPRTVLVRNDLATSAPPPSLLPHPMRVGRDGAGLGWSGSF